MEEQLWTVMFWGFSLCVTGFFTLAGWCWWIVRKMGELMKLDMNIKEINEHIRDIKIALIGSYDKKGLITKHSEIDKKLFDIENRLKKIDEQI